MQEKRKRSQSQPPIEDKNEEKRKFDFLSTANFSANQTKKIVNSARSQENKENSPSLKCISRQGSQEKTQAITTTPVSSKKDDNKQSSFKTPQFCNFRKFEFALQNHRRFVQTLV